MKVSTEQLPQSQVLLEIEVDDERLQRAMDAAFRRLAQKVKIPGFRPGKVPRAVLESHVGEEAIRQEAIDRLMPDVYKEALAQESIEPIDRAEYELVTEQPLVAKFTVPVKPKVDLGDYVSLRLEREPVTVEPERIEENLQGLRHRYSTLEPVERPIQWNDIVRADVDATVDGTPLVKEEDAEFQLVEGRAVSLPGFAETLLGREKGAQFEITVPVPEDAPDERLRGKEALYRVTVKEVKEEVLPELNEDFSRQVGEGFPSVEALRERIKEDLQKALEEAAEHRYHDQAIEALVERAELEYPPVLLERETERLLQDQSNGGKAPRGRNASSREDLDRYLQQVGKSEAEVRDELRPVAEARLRRSLVLSELAEAEHIDVTDSEVEAEIERLTSGMAGSADEVRRLFSSDGGKESLRRSLLTRKTFDRLAEIASADGTAGQEAQTDTGDES